MEFPEGGQPTRALQTSNTGGRALLQVSGAKEKQKKKGRSATAAGQPSHRHWNIARQPLHRDRIARLSSGNDSGRLSDSSAQLGTGSCPVAVANIKQAIALSTALDFLMKCLSREHRRGTHRGSAGTQHRNTAAATRQQRQFRIRNVACVYCWFESFGEDKEEKRRCPA